MSKGFCERCGKALQAHKKSSFGEGETPSSFELGYFVTCSDCYWEIVRKMHLEAYCGSCGHRLALRNLQGGYGNKEPECVNRDCAMFCGVT